MHTCLVFPKYGYCSEEQNVQSKHNLFTINTTGLYYHIRVMFNLSIDGRVNQRQPSGSLTEADLY
jgi:hypothetical protein